MQPAFIAIHLTLLAYFVARRFDLLTTAFYTSSIYFLPAYFGYACYDARDLQLDPLSTQIYVFYICYYLLLFSCSLIAKAPGEVDRHAQVSSGQTQNMLRGTERLSYVLWTLRLIVPALLALAHFTTPGGLWQEDKQDLLNNASMIYPLFENAAYFYVVLAVVLRSKWDVLPGLIYCCIDMVVGFRGTAAFAFFSLLTIHLMQNPKKNLAVNALIPVAIAGAFIFGSVYKSMIVRFLLDGMPGIADYLTDAGALSDSLYQNEAFSQQHIFNKVLETDFRVPTDYALNIARWFFPGVANTLFGKDLSFNDYFQQALYPEVPWGMASNIWAEQYSAGGIIWLYIFVILFFIGLTVANNTAARFVQRGQIDRLLLLVGMVVPTLLFIHRNDLLYELVLVRNMMLLLVAVGLLSRIRWVLVRRYVRRMA